MTPTHKRCDVGVLFVVSLISFIAMHRWGGGRWYPVVGAVVLVWLTVSLLLYRRLDMNPRVEQLAGAVAKQASLLEALQRKADNAVAELQSINDRIEAAEQRMDSAERRLDEGDQSRELIQQVLASLLPVDKVPKKETFSYSGMKHHYNFTVLTPRYNEFMPKMSEEKVAAMEAASEWLLSEIDRVQNPEDCENAKHHVCPVTNSCGAGCGLHQVKCQLCSS